MNSFTLELLKEYNLEIDDIRWMLSSRFTQRIFARKEEPNDLTHMIWSGKLEGELYNMEENFLSEIESQLERNLIDEPWIRDQFAEASELKCRRSKKHV